MSEKDLSCLLCVWKIFLCRSRLGKIFSCMLCLWRSFSTGHVWERASLILWHENELSFMGKTGKFVWWFDLRTYCPPWVIFGTCSLPWSHLKKTLLNSFDRTELFQWSEIKSATRDSEFLNKITYEWQNVFSLCLSLSRWLSKSLSVGGCWEVMRGEEGFSPFLRRLYLLVQICFGIDEGYQIRQSTSFTSLFVTPVRWPRCSFEQVGIGMWWGGTGQEPSKRSLKQRSRPRNWALWSLSARMDSTSLYIQGRKDPA